MKTKTICPVCKQEYSEHPAVSRRTGEGICPACGQEEALDDARDLIAPFMTDDQWMEYKAAIKAISLKQDALQGTM